jgi:hypothetical protein
MAYFAIEISPNVVVSVTIGNALDIGNVVLSVATTVVCTTFIVIRILMISRMEGATGQLSQAVNIIVESAALYTIASLVYLPFDALGNEGSPVILTYINYISLILAFIAVCVVAFLTVLLFTRSFRICPPH